MRTSNDGGRRRSTKEKMSKKTISIVLIVIFAIVVYLFLMLYLDEKSVGLLETIVETEDSDLKKKAVLLINIAQEKKRITILKYIYGSIIVSYIIGLISYYGYKNKKK